MFQEELYDKIFKRMKKSVAYTLNFDEIMDIGDAELGFDVCVWQKYRELHMSTWQIFGLL